MTTKAAFPDEVWVGWDGEQQHHRDGAYLAFVASNHGKEARGQSPDEAVANLLRLYPEVESWPVKKG